MPRAGLSRDVVVDLAVRCVDDGGPQGFADLTLAAVAARAGVAVPSLYKHVGGLPDLRREVALVAVRSLTTVMTESLGQPAAGDDSPSTLVRLARAIRAHARRRPGLYAATQAPAVDAAAPDDVTHALAAESRRAVELVGLALADGRAEPLTGAGLVHAVRAVRAAVHGFVLLETGGGFGLPEDVDVSFDRMVGALETGLHSR